MIREALLDGRFFFNRVPGKFEIGFLYIWVWIFSITQITAQIINISVQTAPLTTYSPVYHHAE